MNDNNYNVIYGAFEMRTICWTEKKKVRISIYSNVDKIIIRSLSFFFSFYKTRRLKMWLSLEIQFSNAPYVIWYWVLSSSLEKKTPDCVVFVVASRVYKKKRKKKQDTKFTVCNKHLDFRRMHFFSALVYLLMYYSYNYYNYYNTLTLIDT